MRLLASSRARRRGLVLALVATALLGGWLWLRDSSLVGIAHVRVLGATGAEAPAIRGALRDAARGMTTLDVDEGALRAAVAILAAAPAVLRPSVTGVQPAPDGLQVALANGPTIEFGDAARPRAKWAAIAAMLADPRAAGASYLDVRAPERPVAGRFPGAGTGDNQSQPQVDPNTGP